jgi:hypothetical protein
LNPTAEQRAMIHFDAISVEPTRAMLKKLMMQFCAGFHDFCELYADFPVLPAMPKMDMSPVDGWKKE